MDLYREEILEHWRSPQNFGQIKEADLVIEQVNPLCGDEITFYFKLKKLRHSPKRNASRREVSQAKSDSGQARMTIIDVSFEGNGCAISIASASLLSEKLKGMPIDVVSKITGEDIFELLGGPVSPARLKCAFLPLEIIRKIANPKSEARNTKQYPKS